MDRFVGLVKAQVFHGFGFRISDVASGVQGAGS